MGKILRVIVLTLALNFLALAGGLAWLVQSGRLDRDRAAAVREIVFPSTQPASTQPTTQPADHAATTQPSDTLQALLARKAGRTAAEQLDAVQDGFDAQAAVLDRRKRELDDLQRQIDAARAQLETDRTDLAAAEEVLLQRQTETDRLASDKGFQDSLEMLTAMPARQAKSLLLAQDDQTLARYLQSMDSSARKRVIREFRTAEELQRIADVTSRMRQPAAAAESDAQGNP